jgi:uncharacterized protein
MKRIGLLSDTHGYIDDTILRHLQGCDEVWHAGDFGSIAIVDKLEGATGLRLKGVSGNIDGRDIRDRFPESLVFQCEELTVYMKHIGGYPGRYAPGVKDEIIRSGAGLFISGHSHILKIIYDDKINCLHINPGAAGKQGWHTVRTLVRFSVHEKEIKDCSVIELGTKRV